MLDLLIVGAGPAGLCAAINAASEGLSVQVLDSGASLGGQAKESNAIENYPGVPVGGATGEDLMHTFVEQGMAFGADFSCPVTINSIGKDPTGLFVLTSDDWQRYAARVVLLSMGLSYRRLNADGIGPLMGKGIYYGAPSVVLPMEEECCVAVIGGANSAGQAVIKLAQNKRATVYLIIRGKIEDKMSEYLIARIRKLANIQIIEGSEVLAVKGKTKLEAILLSYNTTLKMDFMFIYIGATPRTQWLEDCGVKLSKDKFILTGHDLVGKGIRIDYQTNVKGLFAAGDIRFNSVKRIAAACGEGSSAVNAIHRYLAE